MSTNATLNQTSLATLAFQTVLQSVTHEEIFGENKF